MFLYKRAQIFVADVWGAFGGAGLGAFPDLHRLTTFADYRVPVLLRQLSVLHYSPELAAKVTVLAFGYQLQTAKKNSQMKECTRDCGSRGFSATPPTLLPKVHVSAITKNNECQVASNLFTRPTKVPMVLQQLGAAIQCQSCCHVNVTNSRSVSVHRAQTRYKHCRVPAVLRQLGILR